MLTNRTFLTHGKEAVLVFWIALMFGASTVGPSSLMAMQAAPKPLSKEQVIKLLRGDVSPRRVEAEAQQLGIDFEITPGNEKELRDAGADDDLIAALRDLGRKPLAHATSTLDSHDAATRPTSFSPSPNAGPTGTPSRRYLAVSRSHVGWITFSNGVFHFGEKSDKWAIEFPLKELTEVSESKFDKPHGFWHMTHTLDIRTGNGLSLHFMIQNTQGEPDLGNTLLQELRYNR